MHSFVYEVLELNIGSTPEEAIKVLGSPNKYEIKKVNNKYYEGAIDEIHTLYYKGSEFQFYVPNKSIPVKGFPVMFSLTSNEFAIKNGIKIGMPQSEIIKILGAPLEIHKNVYIYHDGNEGSNIVHINFNNNFVSKLTCYFYTG